jgi:hypothetical protein
MKKGLFLFSVLIILIACGSAAAEAKVCGCYFDAETAPRNIKVQFKGSKRLQPAGKGMYINKNTFLRATAPASAKLYCDDGSGGLKVEQLDGQNSAPPVPCLSSPAGVANVVGDKIIDIPRKQGDKGQNNFPSIISPRNTKLIDARPRLSWTSVAGASNYTVKIQSLDGELWKQKIPAQSGAQIQEIELPAEVILKPDVDYQLIVETEGRSSEESKDTNISFRLLTDVREIQNAVREITNQTTEGDTRTFLIASLYAARDLNYDALQLLKSKASFGDSPEALRLVGDLYIKMGLLRLAEKQFLELLKSPLKEKDSIYGQYLTNKRLRVIYGGLGNAAEETRYDRAATRLITER